MIRHPSGPSFHGPVSTHPSARLSAYTQWRAHNSADSQPKVTCNPKWANPSARTAGPTAAPAHLRASLSAWMATQPTPTRPLLLGLCAKSVVVVLGDGCCGRCAPDCRKPPVRETRRPSSSVCEAGLNLVGINPDLFVGGVLLRNAPAGGQPKILEPTRSGGLVGHVPREGEKGRGEEGRSLPRLGRPERWERRPARPLRRDDAANGKANLGNSGRSALIRADWPPVRDIGVLIRVRLCCTHCRRCVLALSALGGEFEAEPGGTHRAANQRGPMPATVVSRRTPHIGTAMCLTAESSAGSRRLGTWRALAQGTKRAPVFAPSSTERRLLERPLPHGGPAHGGSSRGR